MATLKLDESSLGNKAGKMVSFLLPRSSMEKTKMGYADVTKIGERCRILAPWPPD